MLGDHVLLPFFVLRVKVKQSKQTVYVMAMKGLLFKCLDLLRNRFVFIRLLAICLVRLWVVSITSCPVLFLCFLVCGPEPFCNTELKGHQHERYTFRRRSILTSDDI